jgi:hypothetical protein
MAIARDATTNISGTGTSVSTNVTVTGTNLLMLVGFMLTTDVVTSVTFNGVALTQASKVNTAGGVLYLYYLFAPATGTHAFVVNVSSSDTVDGAVTTYTDCLQSGFPDAITTNTGATPLTTSLTTTADNCWTFLSSDSCNVALNNGSASANQLSGNHAQGNGTFDSNAAVHPAGSTSMQVVNGSATFHHIMASFRPFVVVPTDQFQWRPQMPDILLDTSVECVASGFTPRSPTNPVDPTPT